MNSLAKLLAVDVLKPSHLHLQLPAERLNEYHLTWLSAGRLMPPAEVLTATSFPQPEIIRPGVVRSFDDLVLRRADVQHLRLVPVKSNEVHAHYHQQNSEVLLQDLRRKLGGGSMMLAANDFPYDLPPTVCQSIIWYNDGVTASNIQQFITELMILFKLHEADVLAFERPINEETKNLKYVRGSFRHLNHLHLWTKA